MGNWRNLLITGQKPKHLSYAAAMPQHCLKVLSYAAAALLLKVWQLPQATGFEDRAPRPMSMTD